MPRKQHNTRQIVNDVCQIDALVNMADGHTVRRLAMPVLNKSAIVLRNQTEARSW
jgi:hypothetical protein